MQIERVDFASLSGSYNSPFTERDYLGRLDFNISKSWTLFARYIYNQNSSVRGFNPGVYQPFENVDHTPAYAVGNSTSPSATLPIAFASNT